jgi:putative transposase
VSQDNVIKLAQPGEFSDALTAVLRQGARRLLTQAIEAEIASFLETHVDKLTEDGHRRLVRHGHLPEREIATGIGLVSVRQPRVRDRGLQREERIRFSPSILPPYARRSKSLEVLVPILYLKGISTGDFEEALAALLGKHAGGLSASTIARLKDAWVDEPHFIGRGCDTGSTTVLFRALPTSCDDRPLTRRTKSLTAICGGIAHLHDE